MKPATRARIAGLLRAEKQLDTVQCPVKSLADAAVWPDCIKKDPQKRFAKTFGWHFQDEPVCGQFDIAANCPDGNCASVRIERARKLLADRKASPKDRLEALAWLAHLVGDIHQPLHIGENSDKGGNDVKARYGAAPANNLHALWDGLLAERAISSARPPLVRHYPAAVRAKLGAGSVADWEKESWAVSRDFLYPRAFGGLPCGKPEPKTIQWTEDDTQAALPVVDRQVEKAGLRLARLLDEALGG